MNKAHERRFGVEIECGNPILGPWEVAERFPRRIFGQRPSVSRDGSGIELRTPPLQGKEGFEKLRTTMMWLKDNDSYVTTRDGLHVHHEAPEFTNNPKAVRQLVDSWLNNVDVIYKMVAPRRRSAGGPAPMWERTDYSYNQLLQWERGERRYLEVDRNDLNVAALREHGTIEIRLHEGTLDADVAIAWVMFGQRLIHEVARRIKPIDRTATAERLFSRIRLSPVARAAIAAKQAANYETPASAFRSNSLYR